jgi:hypothetical protein
MENNLINSLIYIKEEGLYYQKVNSREKMSRENRKRENRDKVIYF